MVENNLISSAGEQLHVPHKFVRIERFGNERNQFQPEKIERRGQTKSSKDIFRKHEETRAHAYILSI